jgi:ribosomal protein S12 methylthiotransferase accessory factor
MEQAREFCDDLQRAIREHPPAFSISVSQAPFGPGDLAMLLDAPVLPVCLDETEALCGPLYVPGRPACPVCLEHWFDNNMYDRGNPQWKPDIEAVRALMEKMADWSDTMRQAGRVEELELGAVSVAYAGSSTAWHPVFPLRDCPRCAGLAGRAHTSPLAHCSRWTGIVNRMEATRAPSAGAFRASAWWSAPVPAGRSRRYLKRQDSYGRGRTRQDAEAGCIGEAMERYSLIYRGDEAMIRARLGEIDAIHPDDIQLFSETQYREREAWNALEDEMFFVGERFDAEAPVDWLEARALGRRKGKRFVPAACCLMWYEFAAGECEFGRADTVGCGTGVTFHDALTHALLEWIERDAMAIWWENRLQRPGVSVESFESEALDEVAAGLRAIGRNLFLLDCTTDIGIPAYVSVAPRFDGSEPLFAGAAHFSAKTAAYKAATEAGQVWYAAKTSGGMTECLRRWLLRETVATQPYLMPASLSEAPQESGVPAEEAASYIVDRLEAAGLEAYAVDHSRTDVLWPTARAIVPGLRHIWNRRAPGRLFDVPVKMGWLAGPVPESRLNPIRCMI